MADQLESEMAQALAREADDMLVGYVVAAEFIAAETGEPYLVHDAHHGAPPWQRMGYLEAARLWVAEDWQATDAEE